MLTAAVIGCGRMGAEPATRLEKIIPSGWLPLSHAECLKATEGVELVALADVDTARLEKHGRYYGVQRLYTDYHRLLSEVRPDVISIATRTPGKADIVVKACDQGVKGIYVEKPLANSLFDCRRALRAAAETGAVIAYGVNRRYHAVYRQAKQLIAQGEIGDIIDIAMEFGRSQLLWTHPHVVDLMLFFLETDNVTTVQASLVEETVNRQSELLVDSDPIIEHAQFLFDSGIRAHIGRLGGCNVRIGGSRGTMTVHADGAHIQLSKPRGTQQSYFLDQSFVHAFPATSATITAFQELIQAIGKPQLAPIAPGEIEVGLQMLLSCVWSHISQQGRVRIADVPEEFVVTGRYRDFFA